MEWIIGQVLHNQFLVGLSGATLLGGALFVLRRLPALCWRGLMSTFSHEIEVKNNDNAFEWLVVWLAQSHYAQRARRLRLSCRGVQDAMSAPVVAATLNGESQYLLSPGMGWHFFLFRGVIVALSRREDEGGKGGDRGKETITLRVLSRNRGVVQAIVDGAYQLSKDDTANNLVLYTQQYEGWLRVAKKRPRHLNTVIAPDGVVERIADDLQQFMSASDWYAERGIPWRRGYLFEGVPGSGKSSLVAALASHFKMGIAVLNISSVPDDRTLISLFRNVPVQTFLLLEDVDAVFAQRQKASDDYVGVTFAGLLNAIDGVASADGRILFMTTNHVEKLDPALIRPGRIDLAIHFDNATAEQARRMFLRFFSGHGALAQEFGAQMAGRSMAEIQKHLLAHKDSPGIAVANTARKPLVRPTASMRGPGW